MIEGAANLVQSGMLLVWKSMSGRQSLLAGRARSHDISERGYIGVGVFLPIPITVFNPLELCLEFKFHGKTIWRTGL